MQSVESNLSEALRKPSRLRKVFDGGDHFTSASNGAATRARTESTDARVLGKEQSSADNDMADASEKEAHFRDLLVSAGSSELRRIGIVVEDGRVILSGRVTCFYQKQLAQEFLRPHAIGMQIINQIEVDA